MSFSQQDLLILQEAYAAYDANSDYFMNGDETKAKNFVHAITRIMRFPEQVLKDNERAMWNHKQLQKLKEEAQQFLSYSTMESNIHYSHWCRF